MKIDTTPRTVCAVTDTGCQTTTCGAEILDILNIDRNHLIPTSHGILGITDTRLNIIGSIFAQIQLKNRSTKQMIHVSTNSSGLFLSLGACKDLAIVHRSFPDVDSYIASTREEVKDPNCKCLPRGEAPDRPSQIPYLPIESNVRKLKEWLISKFEASAFNTCKHQLLKKMSGAPMKIYFKEGGKPYAIHTPIPIPVHWKEKIKEGIDQDVKLGIIEEVPQGTPTTWCARMVPQGKKNGGVRRTVDLQQLKSATLRETHFTPTPFDIVSQVPSNKYKTVLDAWNGYHSPH